MFVRLNVEKEFVLKGLEYWFDGVVDVEIYQDVQDFDNFSVTTPLIQEVLYVSGAIREAESGADVSRTPIVKLELLKCLEESQSFYAHVREYLENARNDI